MYSFSNVDYYFFLAEMSVPIVPRFIIQLSDQKLCKLLLNPRPTSWNISKRCRSTTGLRPVAALKSKIDSGELISDEYQIRVAERLQRVYDEVKNYTPPSQGFIKKWLGSSKRENIPRGLYLYGAVGGGKTMLMDLFFDCCEMDRKRRVHFNSFMLDVHARIHEVKKNVVRNVNSTKPQPHDPIPPVAASITQDSWLLCFDEFQVS